MQASLNIFHKNVKVRSHKFVRNNLLTLHTKMYSTSNTLESTSDTVKRMKMADLAGPGKSTYEQVKKVLPKNYSAVLNHRETQVAINTIKTTLKDSLCRNLNLQEIAVPLIVSSSSGVNDYLDRDSSRMPVSLTINNDGEHPVQAEVVQAATKWKRLALKQFKFGLGEGLITDMKAIRSGYFLDHDHSATVGQFDWEQTIHRSQRNIDYLKHIVRKIYDALTDAEFAIRLKFPDIVKAFPQPILHEEITFLHAEELLAKYPNLSRKERETAVRIV